MRPDHLCYCCVLLRVVFVDDRRRVGYGIFIVFLYAIVLPSPVVYYYFKDRAAVQDEESNDSSLGFSNPLTGEDNTTTTYSNAEDDMLSNVSNTNVPRIMLAKLQREAKEARLKQGNVAAENAMLRQENHRIVAEMENLKRAPTTSANQPIEPFQSIVPNHEPQPEPTPLTFDTADPLQITAMKTLAEDGMVSERVLEEAKKSLEDHIVEQISIADRARVQTTKLSEVKENRAMAQIELELEKVQLDAIHRREALVAQQLEHMKKHAASAYAARVEMKQWLEENRLTLHELKISQVGKHGAKQTSLVVLKDFPARPLLVAGLRARHISS
eukprot:SAG31_NODE_724_length_12555_cov_11.624277_3_plen_329_part_00